MTLPPDALTHWSVFFSTAAECAATLAGLVLLAISVNLKQIIEQAHLPARAGASVGGLVMIVILSLAGLTPQPPSAFAVEIAIAAVTGWIMHGLTARSTLIGHKAAARPWYETVTVILMGQLSVWPLTIGAVLLSLGREAGLFWVSATVMTGLAASVINGWVLLVEILR